MRARLILASALLMTACRGEPITAPDPQTTTTTTTTAPEHTPQLALPEAKPLVTTPLGDEAWRVLAVSPARDVLAVATAQDVILLALPDRVERARVRLPTPVGFLAFARDGRQLAALGRTDTSDERLVLVDVATGKILDDRTFPGLTSPARDEPGIQPPSHPTGLLPALGADGFWITNAYGVHHAAPGATALTAVPRPVDSGDVTAAQDGRSYWTTTREGLARVDDPSAPGAAVPLECYAQDFVIDTTLGRAVTTCWRQNSDPELHVVEVPSGRVLGRVPTGGDLAEVSILAADRFVAVMQHPSRVGWMTLTEAALDVQWRAQAASWDTIEWSPGGTRAVGVGLGGVQVIDVTNGKILCDHGGLARAGAIAAAGFVDEATLWTLAHRPGKSNQLQVARVALAGEPAACTVEEPLPLTLGKTTNLAPRWVAARPGFVLDALFGSDYGFVFVDLAAAAARNGPPSFVVLMGRATPHYVVSDDGARVGAVDHQSAASWRVTGAKPEPLASHGEIAKLLLCGDRHLTYRWNEGWIVADPRGAPTGLRFGTPQPQALECRGATMLLADHGRLHVIDLAGPDAPRVTETFTLPHRPGPMALGPDGKTVLFPGGATGWRKLSLQNAK